MPTRCRSFSLESNLSKLAWQETIRKVKIIGLKGHNSSQKFGKPWLLHGSTATQKGGSSTVFLDRKRPWRQEDQETRRLWTLLWSLVFATLLLGTIWSWLIRCLFFCWQHVSTVEKEILPTWAGVLSTN